MVEKLEKSQVEAKLAELEGWELSDDGHAIETAIEFEDFKGAFSFMTRIAMFAECENHHPEWFNVYNKLSIRLSTHDCDGVSEKDITLAHFIEKSLG